MLNLKRTVSKYVDELTWTKEELVNYGNNGNIVEMFKCNLCEYIRYNMNMCGKCNKLLCNQCFLENKSPNYCIICNDTDSKLKELDLFIKKNLFSFKTKCKLEGCNIEMPLENMKCHIKNECKMRQNE